MNMCASVTADDYLWIDKSQRGHSWKHWGLTAVFTVSPYCRHHYYYYISHPTILPTASVFSAPSYLFLSLTAHRATCKTSKVCRSLSEDRIWRMARCLFDPRCTVTLSSLIHISEINVNILRQHPSVILPPHQINIWEQWHHMWQRIKQSFHFLIAYFSCCLLFSVLPVSFLSISLCCGKNMRWVFDKFLRKSEVI